MARATKVGRNDPCSCGSGKKFKHCCAIKAENPWSGRILMAVGSAPYNGGYAEVDVDRLTLVYNGTTVLRGGAPQHVEPDASGPSCTIELDLGLGTGRASYLTTDLSYDYVRINAEYTT